MGTERRCLDFVVIVTDASIIWTLNYSREIGKCLSLRLLVPRCMVVFFSVLVTEFEAILGKCCINSFLSLVSFHSILFLSSICPVWISKEKRIPLRKVDSDNEKLRLTNGNTRNSLDCSRMFALLVLGFWLVALLNS